MAQHTQQEGFDPARYWSDRMGARPDLRGTGTSGLPIAWQEWMYRGKKRAYKRILNEAGVNLRNAQVLDFGCGTGYFEDVWLRWGASSADGIDIVQSNIDRLRAAHPQRTYVCADAGHDPAAIASLPQYDIVTAIDVLYHVVEDSKLERTLEALAARIKQGGWFLFTDAMSEYSPAVHVKFRSEARWRELLSRFGLELHFVRPVFARNNRDTPFARRFPWLAGAVYHLRDGIRMADERVNNWVALARVTSN